MRRLVCLASVCALSACAGRLEPNYNGVLSAERAADVPKGGTFAIRPPTGELAASPELASQAARLVREGLEGRGMRATSAAQADLLVDLDFTVGPPRTEREFASTPIYRSYTTPGYTSQVQVGTDRNGRPIYTPVTIAGTTTQYVVGENYFCAVSTVYDKQFTISARPNRLRSSADSLGWDVSVAVRDNVDRPGRYVPMLARAASQFADAAVAPNVPVTLVNGGRKVKERRDDSQSGAAVYSGALGTRRYTTDPCKNPDGALRSVLQSRDESCYGLQTMLVSQFYSPWFRPYGLSYLPLYGFFLPQGLPCSRYPLSR